MARRSPQSLAKRRREHEKQEKRRLKEEKRAERKAAKTQGVETDIDPQQPAVVSIHAVTDESKPDVPAAASNSQEDPY